MTKIAVLCLLLLPMVAGQIHLPLQLKYMPQTLENTIQSLEDTNRKYNFNNLASTSPLNSTADKRNVVLIGMVAVGTPGQRMNILFDLTTDQTWVMSSNCDQTNPACLYSNHFNCTASSTCRNSPQASAYFNTTFPYVGGTVAGFNFTDDICVLTNNTYCRQLTMGGGVSFSQSSQNYKYFDGVYGLNQKVKLKSGTLNATAVCNADQFGLYLPPVHSNSQLTLCGYDADQTNNGKSVVKSASQFSIDKSGQWELLVQDISVDGTSVLNAGHTAMIANYDSTSNFIIGNNATIAMLNKKLGAIATAAGVWTFPDCKNNAHVSSFKIATTAPNNAATFQFKSDRFLVPMTSNGVYSCYSIFAVNDNLSPPNSLILGLPWMQKFYTIFQRDPTGEIQLVDQDD